MDCAVCRKPASGYPCPMCGRFVCSEPCLDEHAIVHIVAAGATEEEARLAMVGGVDSPEERKAVEMFEKRKVQGRS
jgi:hypothetical protein